MRCVAAVHEPYRRKTDTLLSTYAPSGVEFNICHSLTGVVGFAARFSLAVPLLTSWTAAVT